MRLKSLDSVRGVAAFIVVLHHCSLIDATTDPGRPRVPWTGDWLMAQLLYASPLRVLVMGPAAVLVFFVLSGLVLSIGLVERKSQNYLTFVQARICRIYIPFLVAILFAALLSFVAPAASVDGAAPWWVNIGHHPANALEVTKALLMIGPTRLDVPGWSLIHELRISMILPLLIYLTLRNWAATLAGSLVAAVIASKLYGSLLHSKELAGSLVQTLQYVPMFVMGIVISYRLELVRKTLASLRGDTRVFLFVLAIVGLWVTPVRVDQIVTMRDELAISVAALAGGLLIVLCLIEGRAFSALLGRVPVYLGRISYSLYLFHMIVLSACVRVSSGILPIGVALVVGIVLSVGLADMMQRFVELPAMRLGKTALRRGPPTRTAPMS